MIKLRSYTDERDLAEAVAEFLAEHGSEAVKFTNDLIPGEGDKIVPFNTVLIQSYHQLNQLLNLTMNEQASALAHQLIAKTMLASWNVGVFASAAPEVRAKFDELKAGQMRIARSNKPGEIALAVAIETELQGRTVTLPKKEAGAILSGVNAKLREKGHPEVSVDTVFRRLKKMVRS